MNTPATGLEAVLTRAGRRPRFLAGRDQTNQPERTELNFAAIEAELDAPRPSRLARLLARLGVDDRTIPLITATPALRFSWLGSVSLAILFAVNAANTSNAVDIDRITAFLTIAPLIPLLGVAMAFGPSVDPTHETAVAAPIDGFRLFLVRGLTVVTASSAIMLVGSAFVRSGGYYRLAWLLPALAVTSLSLALSTRFDPRVAAGAVASGWLILVMALTNATDTAGAFGATVQIGSAAVAIAGAVAFGRRRRGLDHLSVHP